MATEHQESTFPEPSVINYPSNGLLPDRYKYTGTKDYSAYSTIAAAIDFVQHDLKGVEQVQTYNHELICQGVEYLSTAWNTSLLVPLSMSGSMANVILPSSNADAIAFMQQEMLDRFNTYMVYSSVPDSRSTSSASAGSSGSATSIYFLRLSAQVYLSFADFKSIATRVPMLIDEYEASSQQGVSNVSTAAAEATSSSSSSSSSSK